MTPGDEINLSKIQTIDLLETLKGRGYFASKIPPTASGQALS